MTGADDSKEFSILCFTSYGHRQHHHQQQQQQQQPQQQHIMNKRTSTTTIWKLNPIKRFTWTNIYVSIPSISFRVCSCSNIGGIMPRQILLRWHLLPARKVLRLVTKSNQLLNDAYLQRLLTHFITHHNHLHHLHHHHLHHLYHHHHQHIQFTITITTF